jgi:hypothetical protein
MGDAADHPKEDQPGPPDQTDFQRQFERLIKTYGEATEAGKTEEATQAAFSAFAMAAEEAARNPTPDLKLAQEASDCEQRRDWAGAEAAYRKRLALKQSTDNAGLRSKWQMDLSRLLRLLGRMGEAWELAEAAVESARAFQVSYVLAMALENQALCALDRSDPGKALQAASEAVGVLEPGRLLAQRRARALTLRAECFLARSDLAAAEADLKSSRELLDQVTLGLPGPILSQANWWEVQAKLDWLKGNLSQAEALLTKAISYREHLIEMRGEPSPYAAVALAKDKQLLAQIRSAQSQ